jgi:hypothetical protein
MVRHPPLVPPLTSRGCYSSKYPEEVRRAFGKRGTVTDGTGSIVDSRLACEFGARLTWERAAHGSPRPSGTGLSRFRARERRAAPAEGLQCALMTNALAGPPGLGGLEGSLSGSSFWVFVIAGIVGVVATIAGLVVTVRTERQAKQAASQVTQATLEGRLDELAESMRRSARLVEQVSSDLDARAATARRLQEEAESAEALAALHKDQADAVRRMIDAELATSRRGTRRDTIMIALGFFIAGGGLTLAVTLFVHPFH